jgi:cytochrome c oxidase subunit II
MPTNRTSRMRLFALALPLLAFLFAGCASQFPSLYPPDPVTTEGGSIRTLYDIVFLIAVVIFFLVEGLIIYAVIRYRRRPTDTELPPQIHGNNLIEIVWTVVPTIIVLFMFVVSWQTLNTVDAKTADPTVRIVAVANRFSWDFIYVGPDGRTPLFATDPQGDGVFGSMEVPPGVPIEVQLHSPDVIHAFYVPKFLFKRDVVPGQTNVFDFTVDPGDAGQTFRGQCAELCGVGHYTMVFEVHASKSMADYQAWLQQQIANSPPPAPSGAPGASGAPAGSGAPASGAPPVGSALSVTAKDVAFVETSLTTAPDKPFQIAFTNNDAGVQHNIEIKKPDGSDAFKGQLVTGVATATYDVPALPAGTYAYNCTVHPAMTGTLTVK